MPSITIEPELYQRVEQVASEQQESVSKLLTDAVSHYLWELDRQKISQETRIYRQRYKELKTKYFGLYVALRNGQVVDQDEDFDVLFRRTRDRFGQTPVMITKVEESADHTISRRGIRFWTT